MFEKEAEEYIDKLTKDWSDGEYSFSVEELRQAIFHFAEPREKRIAELESQIEKMKCCANCRHSRTEYEHCKTNKHEKWEIKEND